MRIEKRKVWPFHVPLVKEVEGQEEEEIVDERCVIVIDKQLAIKTLIYIDWISNPVRPHQRCLNVIRIITGFMHIRLFRERRGKVCLVLLRSHKYICECDQRQTVDRILYMDMLTY